MIGVIGAMKVEVDNICELYLLDKLEDEKV